jgi:hypothetical protein
MVASHYGNDSNLDRQRTLECSNFLLINIYIVMEASLFAQFPLIAEIDEIRGLDNFCLSTTCSMLLNEIDKAWIRQVSFAPPEVD